MEDIQDILPNNCTIPINPCRETTFLTSASSEYERESLRDVPPHHRISGAQHYTTPSPAPRGEEKEPRSISQLVNRREDSFSSKEETELGNLRSATSRSSGNSRNSFPTLSESRQSRISFGNVFEKGLFHSKIIPNDSKFPYRLQLPNVKIKEEEENTKRQKFYCVVVTVVLAVFVVGGAILAMVLAVNLAT